MGENQAQRRQGAGLTSQTRTRLGGSPPVRRTSASRPGGMQYPPSVGQAISRTGGQVVRWSNRQTKPSSRRQSVRQSGSQAIRQSGNQAIWQSSSISHSGSVWDRPPTRSAISSFCRAGGGRTHTASRPADFKSAASAYSATAPIGPIVLVPEYPSRPCPQTNAVL